MSIIEAIILGIVQGLTEFLPISSSGHLRIVPAIMGWEDPGTAFTAVIQIGTMAAVVLYFWKDLWEITTAFLRGLLGRATEADRPHVRMGWYLALGTLPIIVFGLLFTLHGTMKLFGWPLGTSVPVGTWPLWWAGLIEFVTGLLISVGLFTRRRGLTICNTRANVS